ncbi:hypothetical protein RDABS01_010960, partial [Bienertia sinuspersici]
WKIVDNIRCCIHLLVSIPPTDDIGDPLSCDIFDILQQEEFLKNKLTNRNLRWLCYLSPTSIYGDAGSAWVYENYVLKLPSNLAKMRLKSEEGWSKPGQDLGLTNYVFPLGGTYGQGRRLTNIISITLLIPFSRKKNHQYIRRATRNFTSRVHVVDICQALKAIISLQQQRLAS